MKQTWRYLVAVITVVGYVFMYIHISGRASLQKTNDAQRNDMGNFEAAFNRTSGDKHTKRLFQFIETENSVKDLFTKQRNKRPKPSAHQRTNEKLIKLIFQLWDLKSLQAQEDSYTCKDLVSVDDKTYQSGKKLASKLNSRFYESFNASAILDAISVSCDSITSIFRTKESSRLPRHKPYPIAYTIQVDRGVEQSIRMLYSTYHPDNVYCLHPNMQRGKAFVEVFKRIAECVPNIFLPDVVYGIGVRTHQRIVADLKCFEKLLESSIPWRYGINLPSSAFPLRNNSFIVEYLKKKPYENEIAWRFSNVKFYKRALFVHVIRESHTGQKVLKRTNRLKSSPPRDIALFRKGEYFISTREFYRFLVNSSISRELLAWSNDTKYPEEMFYATLNRYPGAPGGQPFSDMNNDTMLDPFNFSSEKEDIVDQPNDDLLTTLWRQDKSHRCHGAYRGNMCIFGAADLRWLIAQDALFANSFDYRVDRVSIDCLTKHLIKPILDEGPLIDTRSDLPDT